MLSKINVPITPPRVPFIDQRTDTIAREWYLYLLSLFKLVGNSNFTLNDLQVGPDSLSPSALAPLEETLTAALSQPSQSALVSQVAELYAQIQALASQTPSVADLQQQLQDLALAPPNAMQVPWYGVLSQPRIEAYDTSTSIALTSTPALLKPASVAAGANGITYDAASGEFTFSNAGSYSLSLNVNAVSAAANQFVYIYAENDTGAGWTVNTNSGKTYELTNANMVQIVYAQAVARVPGQKVRYWIYSNDGKVTLETYTLPGSVGAIVPAIRIQYS